MVYTPTWKKSFILVCGLLENLVFTGNILGWSALNKMLKSERIYEEYCFLEEKNLMTSSNNFFNSSNLISNNFIMNETLIYTTPANQLTTIEDDELEYNLEDEKVTTEDEILVTDKEVIENIPNFSNKSSDNLNFNLNRNKRSIRNRYHSYNATFKLNCKKQETILNLAYTIGTFLNGFTAFIWGFLLDKYGLRNVRLVINFFLSFGCFLLCITTKKTSYLIFPAVSFLCLGGVPLRIADMQFANLFPTKRSSVITFYSGAFSASSIVFVILKYFYENGLNYFLTTGILFLISLLMLPVTFFILPIDKIHEDDKNSNEIKTLPNDVQAFTIKNINFQNSNKNDYFHEIEFSRKRYLYNKYISNITSNDIVLKKYNNLNLFDIKQNIKDFSNDLIEPKELPIKLSLYSFPYLIHQYWFCWLITYIIMYVGSMNLWIKRITEDTYKASFYLKIYGLLQVFSLILSPVAGLVMDYQVNKAQKENKPFLKRLKMAKAGFWPLLLTNLSLIGVVICKYFNHEYAIYISIVLNTILRSFLIAVASAYLRIRFPAEHFNKLLGIMSSVGSLMTLIQFPLFIWESNDSHVVWVNTVNTFLTILSFTNPLLLLINLLQKYIIQREQKLESLYLT